MLRINIACGLGAAVVLVAGPAVAENYKYTTITVSGATDTKAMYVNTQRQVAGSYTDSQGKVRVFKYADGKSRKFFPPRPNREVDISPTAIGPTGMVVGNYSVKGKVFPFILRPLADGVERMLTPTSDGEHDVTATAISNNEKEDVAGYLTVGSGTIQGFNTQAYFSEFVGQIVPKATATKTLAFAQDPINGYEIPAGVFVTDQQHGYIADSTTPIDPPGSVNTSLTYFNNGINPDYEYGGYAESKNGKLFGWIRRKDVYTKYSYPGANNTKVTGHIGENVYGEYTDKAGKPHGFQYRGGKYYQVQAKYTEVTLTGLAEDGTFTGYFLDKDGHYRGYIATCESGSGKCVVGPVQGKSADVEPATADNR